MMKDIETRGSQRGEMEDTFQRALERGIGSVARWKLKIPIEESE